MAQAIRPRFFKVFERPARHNVDLWSGVGGRVADVRYPALAVARTISAQSSMATAMVKKGHEMDMALAQMIDQAVRNVPAPTGQGQVVDKTA